VVALLFGCVALSDLLAQGQFQWGNALGGILIAPIYGVDPNNPTEIRRGNTATGTPMGTQTYAGPLLGSGYTAAIYVGRTAAEVMVNNTPPTLNGTASFRNNAAGAGTGRVASFGFLAVAENIPPGTVGHYQFRAWDAQNWLVTSLSQVMAAGGAIAGGTSDIYQFDAIFGGEVLPITTGIRSFQLTQVPEPSLITLVALGLGALLLLRRK
jgi:hypothetical protein